MKRTLTAAIFVLTTCLLPGLALAQQEETGDARLEGYASNVTLSGSTVMLWGLVVLLAGLCVGVMFMNAKRSHMD